MIRWTTALAAFGFAASAAAAQHHPLSVSAQGVVSGMRADPVHAGATRTEWHFERPMLGLSAVALNGRAQFHSALSFEKRTTPDGVLSLGAWGGGYYDRAHPHDYLHEAVISLIGDVGQSRTRGGVSLSAGKGVVPYGSDPPMNRAPLREPVNHHWSQIMERWFGSVGVRMARIGVELTVFDGAAAHHGNDTTHSPTDTSGHGHVGHLVAPAENAASTGAAGAIRITYTPMSGLSLRASAAMLNASGHHPGASATTQQMLHVSANLERAAGSGRVAALAEFAEARVERTFRTALFEAQWSQHARRGYYRAELTDRAEGPRSADLFREGPDSGASASSVSRWQVHTLGASATLRARAVRVEPIAEVSFAQARSVGALPIDLDAVYGRTRMWSASIAIRISAGGHHMMGRYGALSEVSGLAPQAHIRAYTR